MEHSFFISTSELHDLINSNSVQVVDSGINHQEAFKSSHIPGALFFNVSEVRSKSSPLSQEMPSQSELLDYLKQAGFRDTTTPIVVYDQVGIPFAARAWFILSHFGVANVRVLNGGFSKWVSEGRPTESGEVVGQIYPDGRFELNEVQGDRLFYYNINELTVHIKNGTTLDRIWDPRPSEAFEQGTVDTAINVPFSMFFNEDKTVKSREEVAEIIRQRIGNQRIVTSCMKGVNASLGFLLLKYAGHHNAAAYTGSYEEWKAMKSTS
jgi:thiosulfate/3-mercaptopyruvate sulfurtransferase